MAEPDKDAVEPDAVAEEGSGDTKKKGKMGLLLVLIPALLLPAIGGAWLVYARYPQVAQAARSIALIFGDDPTQPEEEAPVEYGEFTQLEGLIVNPAGTEGTRYLMISLGLEAPSAEVFAEISRKDIVVRDTVLKILGTRTVQELSQIESRDRLKTELRSAINGVLTEGEISRLYFTQFVLQ
ncbi:MAG: flagellar basal body protein FliL [Bacteroidetes bacterium]|nr:hypothetical protein AWN76_017465 [Rhodothermaceae bacterium RA]RMH66373.1 MAG: flagellar basal body protein FliL [Bacteroidota bacterium]